MSFYSNFPFLYYEPNSFLLLCINTALLCLEIHWIFPPFCLSISVCGPGAPAPSQLLLAHHKMPARLEVQPHGVLHLGGHRRNNGFFSPKFGKRFLFLSFYKKYCCFRWTGFATTTGAAPSRSQCSRWEESLGRWQVKP